MRLFKTTPKLHKKAGRWNAVFYDPETRLRKWVALGTDRKDIAERRFRDMCRAYEAGDWDPFRQKYQPGGVTLKAAAKAFQEGRDWTEHTRKDYRRWLNMVVEMMPAGLLLEHMTAADCRRIIRRPPARASQRSYHRRLRAFLAWCVKERYIKHSPLDDVPAPKRHDQKPAYLSRAEFAQLVAAIEEAAALADDDGERRRLRRLSAAVRLGVSTGLRLEELRRLTWSDIDTEARRISVVGKGNKYRAVPLFEDAAAVLRELSDRHAAAFGLPPSRSEAVLPGLPYSGTSKDILHWLRETGLKEKAGKKAAHLLRSTFASWAVSAGVPIYAVSQWLGHASIKTTQDSYAHLAPDYTSEAAEEVFGGVK